MKEIQITCSAADVVELAEVSGFQGNLKTINRKNLEKLKNRILKHGFNVPFHIWIHDGKKYLLDGHQRTRALLELQAQGYSIPPLPYDVIQADNIEDAKDKLLGISSQYGDFTMEGLKEFTSGMELDLDLRLPTGELRLEAIKADEEELGDDDEPEAAPNICSVGELWQLGPHRLKIGDSTSTKDVAALFGSQAAQLVFTDPPYGVEYEGQDGGILNDEKKGQELERQLLTPAFRLAVKHSIEDAAFYIWHASATRGAFERAMVAAGLEEKQYLIWVKPSFVMGRSQYQWAHEPCFYCARQGITPRWTGDRRQPTVWHISSRKGVDGFIAMGNGVTLVSSDGSHIFVQRDPPKGKKVRTIQANTDDPVYIATMEGADVWHVAPDSKKDYIHPNQKPVELSIKAIINNTEPGEIVYDAFTGSGSTLIGCQRTGRVFYGMELDPKWADRIIKRWVIWMLNHHLDPVLLRDRKTFDYQAFVPEYLNE